MSKQNDTSLVECLSRLPSAAVADVLQTMGRPGQVVAPDICALDSTMRLAGPALCLKGRAGVAPTRSGGSRPVFEMDRRVRSGCVAVIDTGGHAVGAVIGGNVGLSFKLRGCRGFVTDGGIRDADEFRQIGLPVYARFVTPISSKGLWEFTDLDAPVQLPSYDGGTLNVAPGDFVLGDSDGVVVIPADWTAIVAEAAEKLEAVETRIRQEIEQGGDREDAYARHDRFGHIPRPPS